AAAGHSRKLDARGILPLLFKRSFECFDHSYFGTSSRHAAMTLRAVKPPHETRTRILDAAEELFMQHGFEGTSMRLLTSNAGVNRGGEKFGTEEVENLV